MMPWDNTELWMVSLDGDGSPLESTRRCISADLGIDHRSISANGTCELASFLACRSF
jgi:hypothetical protein